jgi:hypothetical protein
MHGEYYATVTSCGLAEQHGRPLDLLTFGDPESSAQLADGALSSCIVLM